MVLGQVGDAGKSTTAVSTECVLTRPASKGVGKPTYRVGMGRVMDDHGCSWSHSSIYAIDSINATVPVTIYDSMLAGS